MRSLPLAAAGCSLTEAQLAEQGDRARRLSAHVVEATLAGDTLSLRFGPGVDEVLLTELIETERRCCPFFRIDHDRAGRRLEIGVAQEVHRPALEALSAAFQAG